MDNTKKSSSIKCTVHGTLFTLHDKKRLLVENQQEQGIN